MRFYEIYKVGKIQFTGQPAHMLGTHGPERSYVRHHYQTVVGADIV